MGKNTIDFSSPKAVAQKELELLRIGNQEMRNSNGMLKTELKNGLSGVLAAGFNQFNITSFNPLFQSSIAAPITLNFTFMNYFYKTHGIIQTAIDQPVLDALSSGDQTGAGVMMRSKTMDEYNIDTVMGFMEDEDVWSIVANAKIWARLFGGGAIIINDGAKDFSQPLDLNAPLPVLKLYAASRWELGSSYKLDDPAAVDDNKTPWEHAAANAEHYIYYGQRMHKSRVITLAGKEAPWMVRWQLQGWGMSEIEKMIEDFNLYVRTRNVLYDLLNEAKVDVFMIDGMRELLITDGGDQKMLRRLSMVQQAKNMNNALLIDKNDMYEQKEMSFAGIPEIMKQNQMGIASAVKMPVSKIFGVGATGFSSGEDDIENYNSMVQSTVRATLRKPIRQVLDLVMRHLESVGKLDGTPEEYKIEFKPLRVMSAKDEEDIKDKKYQRAESFYQAGGMNMKQFGELVHKENLISVETDAELGVTEDFPAGPAGTMMDMEGEQQQDLMKSQPKESKEKSK